MATRRTIASLIPHYKLHLQASGKRPRTVEGYLYSLDLFADFIGSKAVEKVTKADIQQWLVHLSEGRGNAPGTVKHRFDNMRPFWRWLVAEDEIPTDPTAGMRSPKAPQHEQATVSDEEIRALLATVEGSRDWLDRRDTAIIRVLADTGMRRGGLVNLKVDDVDLTGRHLTVTRKGGRRVSVPFGVKTAQALSRYMRARDGRPDAALPDLWLGKRHGKALTGSGVNDMLRQRSRQAGLRRLVNPHAFRRAFAHHWLAEGGTEGHLMEVAGWTDREMVDRYARAHRAQRARDAHRRIAPGDRF